METDQGASLDRISMLPQNIIEHILTLMPIRYALRTSILSKKWQYSWRTMPKLVFTIDMLKLPPYYCFCHRYGSQYCECGKTKMKKYILVNAIFHVLLLHNGPAILEFNFDIYSVEIDYEFDQIISYLSRGSDVKELIFIIRHRSYKLPISFFSMQGLERMHLDNCKFEPPVTFNGFSKLRRMMFMNVEVSAKMLQRFLSNCPLLEQVSLNGKQQVTNFTEDGNNFTFVDLFRFVPLIKILEVSKRYMKYLSAGGMPHKLPTSPTYLKELYLDVCLLEQNEISSVLCIIKSSPMLEKVIVQMCYNNSPVQHTPTNFLDPKDYSDMKLDHLETLKIYMFNNLPLEMEFVKLIMAKSPMLKKVRIELNVNVSRDEELEMLKDLVLLPFTRASPSAKLIFVRP